MRALGLLTVVLGLMAIATPRCPGAETGTPADATTPTLTLADHVEFISGTTDAPTREPMIVEHPDGTVFVSGYSRAPQSVSKLWKSSDRGAHWSEVSVGSEAEGKIGNSDVDLAVAEDGTLYFVSMSFDRKTSEGTQVAVGVSADIGKTWHWSVLAKKRFIDRPWVAVAPDGTAHVIWNDGSGVYHTMSRDRGATWSAAQRIHPDGGSSHLAAGANGELAVRITPMAASGNKFSEGVDLLAVSSDGGATWQTRAVAGRRNWAPAEGATPRWVEPVAWDAKGNLYLLWTEVSGVWMARSRDRGVTWSSWKVAESEGDSLLYYPYLSAQGAGELGATWFSGAGESLSWQACRIQVGDADAPPRIIKSSLLRTDSWRAGEPIGNAPVRSTAGEYLPVLFLRSGDLAVVSPIQNAEAKRFGFSFWRFNGRP